MRQWLGGPSGEKPSSENVALPITEERESRPPGVPPQRQTSRPRQVLQALQRGELTRRAEAFRAQGHFEAPRESLEEALRSRSRSGELRQAALIERGKVYLDEGKKGMARKDFERVLAENSDFEGLRELLAAAS